MYSIQSDARRRLVTIKIVGLLTSEEVAQLYHEEHRLILEMGCRVGEHLALVDLTECKIQLQDVAAAFQKQITSSGRAKRLAMFTGSSLARMQARRLMQRADADLFSTREEAEAWLFQDEGVGRAA